MKHTMLEDLYYGNICPSEQAIAKESDYVKALEAILACEDYLNAQPDKAGESTLQKLIDAYTDMLAFSSKELFMQGFRMGIRMGMEIMDEGEYNLKALIDSKE